MSERRVVLVTGGRDYANRDFVYETLDAYHEVRPITLLVQGGASGADALAREWAFERGVPAHTERADWKLHGKAAGPIRNQRMLDKCRPSIVIAFPGGDGTADMTARTIAMRRCPVVFANDHARAAEGEL